MQVLFLSICIFDFNKILTILLSVFSLCILKFHHSCPVVQGSMSVFETKN